MFDYKKVEELYPGAGVLMIEPQLIHKGTDSQLKACDDGTWFAEIKKDGALYMYVKGLGGENYLFGRTISKKTGLLTEKSANIPHIISVLSQLPNGTILLGEIYYPGKTSKDVTSIMGCLPTKAIERQKCGVKEEGNIIIVFIYFTIGTDRTNLSLKLLKQEDELHQIKQEQPNYIGKSNLENRLNYPQDEQRLKNLEETSIGFKNTQDELHQQLEQLIQQSMQLINETYFLQEDNAKLKERIKIISTDNNLRKNDLIKLRNENRILKEENVKLNNDNSILEQKLKNKQENNVKDLEENNRKTQTIENNDPDDGPIARTTKFEKSEVQTFVSRPTIRPAGQSYQENNEFNNSMNDKGQFKNFSVKHS